MKKTQNQPIAVEGRPFIVLFAAGTLICALLGWGFPTFILLLLTCFTVYFFRNPKRVTPMDAAAVTAPADGKVVFVGKVKEERYFQGDAVKVSIFMSVFNVHVNRAPFAGKVVDMYYNKGRFFNASLDKASLENEQNGMLLETADGKRLLVVQIAGLIARRIVTYSVIGDLLAKGERYGLIRFGSRVDIYLPVDCELLVRLGDRTVGGETILGFLR